MTRTRRLPSLLLGLALLLGSLAALPASAREDRPGKGGPHVGGFERAPSSSTVSGSHVSFEWEPTALRNFTVNGTRLFDLEVAGPAERAPQEPRISGSTILVRGANYEFRGHDNPTAGFKLEADGPIAMRLAPGAVATPEGRHLRVDFGPLSGLVFGEDDLTATAGVVAAEEDLRFTLAAPLSKIDSERPALAKATAEKKIGAEINLAKGKTAEVSALGGNVTARILRSPELGDADLLVQVEGHGFDGRVIVLNVDGAVLGAAKRDDLHVAYDNVTIRAAEGGLADVLNPDDDGLHPEYWLGHDPLTGSFQLAVSVPHYSVHEIRVQSLLAEGPVSIVVGVVTAFAVLAVSAVVLFRPRRA